MNHVGWEELIWTKFLLKAGPTRACLLRPCLARFCLLTRVETLFHCNLFSCLITAIIVGGGRKTTNKQQKKNSNYKKPLSKPSHFPCQKFSVFYLYSFVFSLTLIHYVSEKNFALSSPGLPIQLKRAARSSLCILFVSSTNAVLSLISLCIPVPLQS